MALMAGKPFAVGVGWTSGGQSSTSGSLPSGAVAGDYVAISYFSGVNITQGGGASVFTTITDGDIKISHRRVETDDLTNNFTFNSNTPFICRVWRGPASLSALRTDYASSGATDYPSIPGITKAPNCVAIYGVASVDSGEIYLRIQTGPETGPFEDARTTNTTGISYSAADIVDVDEYADGTVFRLGTTLTGPVSVLIYELLA